MLPTVQPYLPGAKASGPVATPRESSVALLGSFAQLSTKANPWLSGRAGIAVTEARTISEPASVNPCVGFSIAMRVQHGGLQLGALWHSFIRPNSGSRPSSTPIPPSSSGGLNRYGVPGLLNIDSQRPANASLR